MTAAESIRLRLLGVPAVEGPGEDAAGVVSQPKRLALLAYLAVQGGFVRRDVLVEMFWPDSDADRARRALSQATHTLRRALGRSAIRSRGNEELGISPDHVWIDVRAFEAAVAGERWEEAVTLHRDELLHGLNGDQVTPEFSRWLDGERLRLQRSAAGAAKRLADDAFRAGDVAGAIAWARKAVAVRPMDEGMFRDYLALLDEAGDAALALSEYESFRSRLGTEYDLEPARETVRLIEMIRSRRPETVPAVRPESASAAESSEALVSPPEWQDQPSAGRRRTRVAVVSAIAIVAVAILLSLPLTNAAPLTVPNRVAVMYLGSMGGETAEMIAVGVTDGLIEHLSGYTAIEVLPKSAVDRYRGREFEIDSLVTVLRASFFVTGMVRDLGEETHVTLEVISADGRGLRTEVLEFDGANPGTIAESAVRWVVATLRDIGEAVEEREIRYGTSDSLAGTWTLLALTAERKAVEYGSRRTFDLVPAQIERADSLLRLAVAREPRWSKPYLYLGRLAATRVRLCFLVQCEWDTAFDDGIAALTTIINRGDDLAEALEVRANLRWMSWFYGVETDTTVLNMAVADALAAIEVSDSRPLAHNVLGAVYMERGQWANAATHARWALERDEFGVDRSRILDDLFEIAFNMGDDSLALEYCDLLRAERSDTFRFVHCELILRAWTDLLPADVDESRDMVDTYFPPDGSPFSPRPLAELLVAGVMAARADGGPGSGAAVERYVADIVARHPHLDERFRYAAAAMARLNKHSEARAYLIQYLSVNQTARWHVSEERFFAGLDFNLGQLDPLESTGR